MDHSRITDCCAHHLPNIAHPRPLAGRLELATPPLIPLSNDNQAKTRPRVRLYMLTETWPGTGGVSVRRALRLAESGLASPTHDPARPVPVRERTGFAVGSGGMAAAIGGRPRVDGIGERVLRMEPTARGPLSFPSADQCQSKLQPPPRRTGPYINGTGALEWASPLHPCGAGGSDEPPRTDRTSVRPGSHPGTRHLCGHLAIGEIPC